MKELSYSELAALTGEVLPERAVLSTLLIGGDGDSYNNNNAGGNGGAYPVSPGTTIAQQACQSNIERPDGGLLQLVGLHSQNSASSLTCVPGSTVSGH